MLQTRHISVPNQISTGFSQEPCLGVYTRRMRWLASCKKSAREFMSFRIPDRPFTPKSASTSTGLRERSDGPSGKRLLAKRLLSNPFQVLSTRLRDVVAEVETAIAVGVSRAAILEALHEHGFTMTLKSFESALYRIRKQQRGKKAGVAVPSKSSAWHLRAGNRGSR